MGGFFVNYFNRFGRQWQVYVLAEGTIPDQRPKTSASSMCGTLRVSMVPLSSLTKFESRNGPEFTMHFNEYRSAQLNGAQLRRDTAQIRR